ncbi:OLC1v1000889C1 [Oldenlandia corymbosa var. corymbosa]|uniref:OLC1v1000889C1 n=1 Tax=Oldenlandia corymbosa var. corymbosa TaxID=529605 RepID=A0AAV1D3V4_OLDCO|nr:OLC1v1000889C1 [Oldenlandia corymbosa var. corymbosa]
MSKIIEEAGSHGTHLTKGDRVAMEPGAGIATAAKKADTIFALKIKFFATPPDHGSLADQNVHLGDLCFKLRENMSLEEGAMCEPLSVAGSIELVALLVTRSFSAPSVVANIDDYLLSVAKKLGAFGTVKVSSEIEDVEIEVEKIPKAMTLSVDASLDCAGFNKTLTTALSATRNGGKVCLVGMGHCDMTLPLTPVASREVDILGIFRYKNTWPQCIKC